MPKIDEKMCIDRIVGWTTIIYGPGDSGILYISPLFAFYYSFYIIAFTLNQEQWLKQLLFATCSFGLACRRDRVGMIPSPGFKRKQQRAIRKLASDTAKKAAKKAAKMATLAAIKSSKKKSDESDGDDSSSSSDDDEPQDPATSIKGGKKARRN